MRKLSVVLVSVMCLSSMVALGATLDICATGVGLDRYVALGAAGCQIDDKAFYNFTYSASGSGGAVAIPASGVTVTPLFDPLSPFYPGPGLQFQAAWSVGPGQTLDSLIQYDVRVLAGGAPIVDVSAQMVSGTSPNGIAAVAEVVTEGGMTVASLFLHDNGGLVQSQEVPIAPTFGPLHIAKDISVNGQSTGAATISMVSNRFSEAVPEPATMFLLGSALLGLGLVRRRIA